MNFKSPKDLAGASERLAHACMEVAAILDSGDRDPTWHESQELENAALELGRMLNRQIKEATR